MSKVLNNFQLYSFCLALFFSSFVLSQASHVELCNSTNVNKFIELKNLALLNIDIHKNKKWTKNLLKAITNKEAKDISQKFKKRFNSTITAIFDNSLSCTFKAKIRINGDHRDHLDFAPSLDVELINGNINSVTSFKLFIPHTRSDKNEIFVTALLRELGFLAPKTYYVNAILNEKEVKYIFQEKIVKEFIESNKLREGPVLEGDERFIFNAGLPFGLSRQINEKWINGGLVSLDISKYAVNKLNKIYLEYLLGEQYFLNRNASFFKAERLSINDNIVREAQEFSAIMLALSASHGLRPHNRKFYFDPMYSSFRPIYYDGHASILDDHRSSFKSFLDSIDGVNVDEIIGSKTSVSLLKELNRPNFVQNLKASGLIISGKELDSVLDNLIQRLNSLANLDIHSQVNDYMQYFLINKNLEDEGLKKGLRLAFLTESSTTIEVCNFELTICNYKKLDIGDYSKLLSGKYTSRNGRQYIFIGNKQEYVSGIEEDFGLEGREEYYVGDTQLILIGQIDLDLDLENRKISFIQNDSDSRVLFSGGSLENWEIEFFGSKLNLTNSNQRFDKNLLTGCITFMDLEISNLSLNITNPFCEDGVNFIRSHGSISSILVTNAESDALDADYSDLTFLNLTIDNALNDCVDFSSGQYHIYNAKLSRCSDKAISGGERTRLFLEKVRISNSNVGIASKDSSIITLEEIVTDKVDVCFSAYNKKQEFWGGEIFYNLHNCKSEQIYSEKGSSIVYLN